MHTQDCCQVYSYAHCTLQQSVSPNLGLVVEVVLYTNLSCILFDTNTIPQGQHLGRTLRQHLNIVAWQERSRVKPHQR